MKRRISVAAIGLAVSLGLAAQTNPFGAFETALGTFSTSMASALSLNASVGSTWSDAYVGGFPRFGVGAVVGAAFTGAGSVDPLFSALGQTVPTYLASYGVPIPALGLSAKIGIPFLPIDVGLSGGYIPQSLGDSLKASTGVTVNYMNVAGQIRVALLKENIILPDISFGVGLSYQEGSVSTPLGVGTTTLVNDQKVVNYWTVTAPDPNLALGWKSTNVDATLQVSKSLLIFRPYAGLGYTMGSSTVTGGVNSTIQYAYSATSGGALTNSDYTTMANEIASVGGTAPTFSSSGFSYTATSSTPMFRVYGGLSFEILILKLDAQVMYVPANKNLGASLMTRLQI
ncbi:MAG TPA: hypothetical protein VMV44_12645 [Rectinemataceae bacterium]|nr:hypothetical protein [Rectinemataceae bacterium]